MSQFIESIKCENGKIHNLEYHNLRFNQTRKVFFGANYMDLAGMIHVPESAKTGIFKCRVLYDKHINQIEFIPHTYRIIKSLKLVENNSVEYNYKYINREILKKLFKLRGDSDDILIVKNGCITDSFSANVVFYDGYKWHTPETPLLPGTCRARLLNEGKISTSRITPADLSKFISVRLINAMQDLNDAPSLPVENIFP